jgi:hypothetical protein
MPLAGFEHHLNAAAPHPGRVPAQRMDQLFAICLPYGGGIL